MQFDHTNTEVINSHVRIPHSTDLSLVESRPTVQIIELFHRTRLHHSDFMRNALWVRKRLIEMGPHKNSGC